jgi:preprotein translocase subunit Sss1
MTMAEYLDFLMLVICTAGALGAVGATAFILYVIYDTIKNN